MALALLAAQWPASPALAQAFNPARADLLAFVDEVAAKHGFEREALMSLLGQAESRPSILRAIAKPAERTLRWDEYRGKFLVERRIERGSELYGQRRAELERAQATTGVPVDVILGIVGVETFFGENIGKHRVLDALATLAFDYPPRQKFFRAELEQYLVMAREEGLDPTVPVGSYAGAMGLPQFMPSSFRAYALDGDEDGRRDLWKDWADVFLSVGNYLKVHGWRAGEPIAVPADASGANLDGLDGKLALSETVGSLRRRGLKFETTLPDSTPAMLVPLTVAGGTEYRVGFANFYAITRYNRSVLYASAVSDLAAAIGARRSGLVPDAATPPLPAAIAPTPAPTSTGGWSTTTDSR